ncbi:unnamed protein product [Sphacelaria rigidula]
MPGLCRICTRFLVHPEGLILHAVVVGPLTLHPHKTGTEHAGFLPDQACTETTKREAPWCVRRVA